jgi:hypothetical protein
LNVETPEGRKIGEGVYKVSFYDTTHEWMRISEPRGGANTAGEAVVVDIGPRGLLFVLLTGDVRRKFSDELSANAVERAGFVHRGLTPIIDYARQVSSARTNGRFPVLPEELPMMIRFKDIHDPMSAELIDPKDLSKTFGAGVSLGDVFVDITDDPVTTGIEKWLPWVGRLQGSIAHMMGVRRPYMDLLNQIYGGSFKLGV